MLINPNKITNYNLNTVKLQYNIIFWLLVAGKTAKVVAARMNDIFKELRSLSKTKHTSPFKLLSALSSTRSGHNWLADILQKNGIGCQNTKAKGLLQLSDSGINLKTCLPDDLEKIHGIGMKSARCFIIHTRKNAKYSGLDTHLLSFMSDLGFTVPKSTPSSKKQYLEIEKKFLGIVAQTNKTPAELDLIVWRIYSSHQHLKPILLRFFHGKIFPSQNST